MIHNYSLTHFLHRFNNPYHTNSIIHSLIPTILIYSLTSFAAKMPSSTMASICWFFRAMKSRCVSSRIARKPLLIPCEITDSSNLFLQCAVRKSNRVGKVKNKIPIECAEYKTCPKIKNVRNLRHYSTKRHHTISGKCKDSFHGI